MARPLPRLARSGGKGPVYEEGSVSAGGIWAGGNVVSVDVGRRTHPTYSREGAGEPAGSKGSRCRLNLAQLLTLAKLGWTEIPGRM